MKGRVLSSAVIVLAVVAWARCEYRGRCIDTVRFQGCFEGTIEEPAGGGRLTVIVEGGVLAGCLQINGAQFATLAGDANPDHCEEAHVQATPTAGSPPYKLLLRRHPDGDVDAVTLDVSNDGGAPFESAPGLTRCASTCADLSVALPFTPAEVAP